MAPCTFKRRLQHRCRFEGEEEFLSVFAERSALLSGHDELPNEPSPVPDVVVLVVLGQVENILSQQLSLWKKTKRKNYEKSETRRVCEYKLRTNTTAFTPVWSW